MLADVHAHTLEVPEDKPGHRDEHKTRKGETTDLIANHGVPSPALCYVLC